MISYIDIAFIAVAVIMVIVNARRGLLVALLSMLRFVIIIPLSYYLAGYVKPYVPSDLFGDIPSQLFTVILFVIILIILTILTFILLCILKKLQKKKGMPLRHTNAVFGGIFGFVKALIIVFVLSSVLKYAVEIIPQTNQLYDMINNSYAVDVVNNINLFNI